MFGQQFIINVRVPPAYCMILKCRFNIHARDNIHFLRIEDYYFLAYRILDSAFNEEVDLILITNSNKINDILQLT